VIEPAKGLHELALFGEVRLFPIMQFPLTSFHFALPNNVKSVKPKSFHTFPTSPKGFVVL
jgi:hypothetical protein